MGFYVRKSLRAGPFRFNLSKSGLGVSTGVPGFRVGTGPRGNYVQIGKGGAFYRATLDPHGGSSRRTVRTGEGSLPEYLPSGVVMEDATGTQVSELEPAGFDDLTTQLCEAAKQSRVAPWVAVPVIAVGAATLPWGLAVWAAGAPVSWWLAQRDRARRSVVVFYDVEDTPADRFQSLVDAWANLTTLRGFWRVVESGAVRTTYQLKTNAGASTVVQRIPITRSESGPPHLVTNISVPSWTAGRIALYFLPDRVLVREGAQYSDVAYSSLRVTASTTQFIEGPGPVLPDATQVGETWQYVNLRGGPDRRFANNPVLPIVLYGHVEVTTSGGLDWEIQLSQANRGKAIVDALDAMRD
ncbi:MAG: DUF4236 domain-containing protein [Demequinaceae bacterium]|nr:DUF4236 domain-containing protein [Demequinaceae bacterium]